MVEERVRTGRRSGKQQRGQQGDCGELAHVAAHGNGFCGGAAVPNNGLPIVVGNMSSR